MNPRNEIPCPQGAYILVAERDQKHDKKGKHMMEISVKEKSSAGKMGTEHVLRDSLCRHPFIEFSQPCFRREA